MSAPPIVWLAGRPGSGKTTLARRLVAALVASGQRATLVDSDEARAALTPAPTYDDSERALVYRALAYVAARLSAEGILPVIAATAHEERLRAMARGVAPDLLLVHVDCPLAVCEARDPKGLYAAARTRADGRMPGVHVPFEPPTDAFEVVDGSREILEETLAVLTRKIMHHMRAKRI